jgi:glucosamine-6-phosphate deaminase
MNVHVFQDPAQMTSAAADHLAAWLLAPGTRNLMVAGGNSPLPLYRTLASRGLPLGHLHVFPLDEYVGPPNDHPRTCSNLLTAHVAMAWSIPLTQFFPLSTHERDAAAKIIEHENRIEAAGGLDVIVLGLGQNGHLGFNEPGSRPESGARIVDLEPSSVDANRTWFNGEYSPVQGATVGLRTILAARRVLILAHGVAKQTPVHAMVNGPIGSTCPASFLQQHPDTHLFADQEAAGRLETSPSSC